MQWLAACVWALAVALLPAEAAHAATKAPAKKTHAKAHAKSSVKATTKAGSKASHAQAGRTANATMSARGVKGARLALHAGKRGVRRSVVYVAPAPPSFGHLSGLQRTEDALDLKSSVALVVDQDTNEVLVNKNSQAILPIASITKLMTALVVTEHSLPMNEMLVVSQDDVDATAGSRSRLKLGTQLRRGEMLHLALMSSENRAAHVLGRNYPGGVPHFVSAMNAKARELGMGDTRYVEPTGLSSDNQSSAQDLARLVRAASVQPLIRELSTSREAMVPVNGHDVQFRNTNGLVRNPDWDISLQKTGYISAAGRCLVMQAQLAGRSLILVLLDSAGKYSRIGDAERIRRWLAAMPLLPAAMAAQPPQ